MGSEKYIVKDREVKTFRRVPICKDCDVELKSSGEGYSNAVGSYWGYSCPKCHEKIAVNGLDQGTYTVDKKGS